MGRVPTARFLYTVAFFLVYSIDLFLLSILSFKLTPENYLYYQQFLNLLPLLAVLVSFGAPMAITYFRSRGFTSTDFLAESNYRCCVAAVVLILVLGVANLYGWLSSTYVVSAFVAGFISLRQNAVSFYLGASDLVKASLTRVALKFCSAVILLCFIYFSTSLNTFVIGLIFGELIACVFLIKMFPEVGIKKAHMFPKRALVVGRYSFLSNLFSMAAVSVPLIILTYTFESESELSRAALAIIVFRQTSLVVAPALQLIMPRLAPLKTDKLKLRIWFHKNITLILLFGVFVALVLKLVITLLFPIFFDQHYQLTAVYFSQLLFAIPATFAIGLCGAVLSSIGKVRQTCNIALLYLIVTIILLASISQQSSSLTAYCLSIVFIQYFTLVVYLVTIRSNLSVEKLD